MLDPNLVRSTQEISPSYKHTYVNLLGRAWLDTTNDWADKRPCWVRAHKPDKTSVPLDHAVAI